MLCRHYDPSRREPCPKGPCGCCDWAGASHEGELWLPPLLEQAKKIWVWGTMSSRVRKREKGHFFHTWRHRSSDGCKTAASFDSSELESGWMQNALHSIAFKTLMPKRAWNHLWTVHRYGHYVSACSTFTDSRSMLGTQCTGWVMSDCFRNTTTRPWLTPCPYNCISWAYMWHLKMESAFSIYFCYMVDHIENAWL